MKNKTLFTALGFLAVGGCSNETPAPEQDERLQNFTPEQMIDKLPVDGVYTNETSTLVEDVGLQNLTQEQIIEKLLAELAKKPAPEELKFGAMCYSPRIFSERIEYICPDCGAKTIHDFNRGRENFHIQKVLESSRRLVKEIQALGLNINFDERSMCDECRAQMDLVPKTGELYAEITLNGKTTRSLLKHSEYYPVELVKLKAFLEGKQVWPTSNDGESLLLPELPRIRQLLGLDEQ